MKSLGRISIAGLSCDPLVELAAAHDEGGHDLARQQRLPPPGDHAGLREAHHAVGEHLGVDAEVVAVAERREHRVRDRADADLERGAVRDQRWRRAGRSPRPTSSSGSGGSSGSGASTGTRCAMRSTWTNESPSVRGMLRVDLGDDQIGRVDRGAHDVDRDAEADVAVRVGRAHLDERHVDAHAAASG